MQNFLKQLRKERNITQAKMAHDLGVAVSTVQNWESDRTEMTGYSLIMVADYLGVPVDAVYGRPGYEYSIFKFDPQEDELLSAYRSSNQGGQKRILEYAEMISKEYPKSNSVEESA